MKKKTFLFIWHPAPPDTESLQDSCLGCLTMINALFSPSPQLGWTRMLGALSTCSCACCSQCVDGPGWARMGQEQRQKQPGCHWHTSSCTNSPQPSHVFALEEMD